MSRFLTRTLRVVDKDLIRFRLGRVKDEGLLVRV